MIHNVGFGGGYEIEGAKLYINLEIDGKDRQYDIAYMARDILDWNRFSDKRADFLENKLPESFPINDDKLDINAIEKWLEGLAKK